MKDVSQETERVLSAVRKTSEILDSLSIEDHAASIATLQVLAQRRITEFQRQREEEKHKLAEAAQSSLLRIPPESLRPQLAK